MPTSSAGRAESLLQGRLEMNYRSLVILTFGGGTNEIQRDLIAMFGLGPAPGAPGLRARRGTTMDFSFTEEQDATAELATQILTDRSTHERLRELERSGEPRFDRDTWAELAKAGLLGIAVPESAGGAGLGLIELAGSSRPPARPPPPCRCGRRWPWARCRIAEFGSDELQADVAARRGRRHGHADRRLARGRRRPARRPSTVARRPATAGTVTGTKICVPAAQIADAFVVPAVADGGPALFLVADRAGRRPSTPLLTTSGSPDASLVFDGAPATLLATGADAVGLGLRAGRRHPVRGRARQRRGRCWT